MNAIIETGYWRNDSLGAHVQLMFPAIYKLSCAMHGLRYFPYDEQVSAYFNDEFQNCTFIISSWTHDSSTIDYYARDSTVNLKDFQKNQEWDVISFEFERFAVFSRIFYQTKFQQKFKCCEHPWVMLYAHLVIRRRPLYYIINLVGERCVENRFQVIPTSIITCVAVTGFFTPSSTSNERDEKLYLGINTLMVTLQSVQYFSDYVHHDVDGVQPDAEHVELRPTDGLVLYGYNLRHSLRYIVGHHRVIRTQP